MVALTTPSATPFRDSPDNNEFMRCQSFVPSASESEAKSRFTTSVTACVEMLMQRGMGRDRASRELLNVISDGCSPDEDEIFKVMETRGLSYNDATRVMTVAAAFDKARSNNGEIKDAIDQLTSRLDFSRLTIHTETKSSSTASHMSTPKLNSAQISRNESTSAISPTAMTKKCSRTKGKANRVVSKGKKRALVERATTQAIVEDANKSANIEVEEKMLNAKMNSKSPEAKPRTKRASAHQLEELPHQPAKRARTAPDTTTSAARV